METETDLREPRDVDLDEQDVERLADTAQPGRDAADRAAGPEEGRDAGKAPADLTGEEEADATAWLLDSFDGEEGVPTQHLLVNVGSREEPKKIPWTVQAIPREVVQKIRAQSEGNRQQRRSGFSFGVDADPESIYTGNLRIIIEGTVEPDVKTVAAQRSIPAPEFLRSAFGLKGGIVDYIAGEILALSGFDPESLEDADVSRAPRTARAAGN